MLLTISEAEEVRLESQLSRQQPEERLGQLEDLVSQLVAQKGEQALSVDQNRSEDTSNRNSSKRAVKAEDVEDLLADGWNPMMTLPDRRGKSLFNFRSHS